VKHKQQQLIQLPWLPVLSDIEPSPLRYKAAVDKLIEKTGLHAKLSLHILCVPSSAKLPAITQAAVDRHSPNKRHLPVVRWMEVGSGGQFLSNAWPYYPATRIWPTQTLLGTPELLLDQPRPLCNPVESSSTLQQVDMCPCGKCQTMSHIVNSCPQSKLEGAAAIALSWWCCYRMAEDIQARKCIYNNNIQLYHRHCRTLCRNKCYHDVVVICYHFISLYCIG